MNEQTGKPVFKGEILLCEDNSMNRDVICKRLEKLGLKTITAENGKEGVERVKYRIQNGIKPFNLIFMDIFMPVMDGFEAAAEIGKLKTETPIIAMTADNTSAGTDQYTAGGMSDCLNKPFTSQELLDCLMKYLMPLNQNIEHYQEFLSVDAQAEEKLKKKLMHTFVKQYKNLYNEITKAVDDGDIKLAHRQAHTLKSNAAFFGKMRLQKAAQDVETILRGEENRLDQPSMDALKTELEAVFDEFLPLLEISVLNETKDSIASGSPDSGDIQILFNELEEMIGGGDIRCLNLLDRLRSIPETCGHLAAGSLIQELIQQIEYFEFDTALKTLGRLRGERREIGYE